MLRARRSPSTVPIMGTSLRIGQPCRTAGVRARTWSHVAPCNDLRLRSGPALRELLEGLDS
jgi:hypothetical protein